MSSTPNIKASSSKKNKSLMKGNVIDFESVSLTSLKKYRSQFQIRIKPTVPKSELAAAIAEHFASIPVPEETEVIDKFFKALQKNRTTQSETDESADEPPTIVKKYVASDLKKRSKDPQEKDKTSNDISFDSNNSEISKNSTQSNLKKTAKRNSIPKVEKPQSQTAR